MDYLKWRKDSRLSNLEVANIFGVTPQTISNARSSGICPKMWNAFARVVGRDLPEITFGWSNDFPEAYFCDALLHEDGVAPVPYGPADIVEKDGRIAAHIVLLWACQPDRSEEDYQKARKFLRYWPDGPQLK